MVWDWIQQNWQGIVSILSFLVAIASLGVAVYAVRSGTVMERRLGKVLILSVLSAKHSIYKVMDGIHPEC